MKRFSSDAIKARALERLRLRSDWALISGDGTVSALLDTQADSNAELARYLEYLLAEKKWTTAQNASSLISQAALIGRKPKRKRSAIGYVVVSHTDVTGNDRLNNYGQTFFNLDDSSDYDNILKDTIYEYTRTQALVPWTHTTSYVIPRGTRFKAANGTEFVATETLASRSLKEPYSSIIADDVKKSEFYSAGGWNGIKYLKVPVIQGIVREGIILTNSAEGKEFESFLLSSSSCEDASNSISSSFLKFYVTTSSVTEEWTQIPDISLAGPLDKVYEIENLPDYSGVVFKVGDGITGSIVPTGSQVKVDYLETSGANGNINKKYQISSIIFADNAQQADPRTGAYNSFLSTTNIVSIMGGEDEESVDDLKTNAPKDYLKYYAVSTVEAYEEQIKSYAPIGLSKVKVYPAANSTVVTIGDFSATSYQNQVYVTAISSNGEMIEDPTNQFLNPIVAALGDLKAPSDVLSYIEPNFIKLKLSNIIYSNTREVSDEEVKTIVKQALLDKYSIFNTEFKQPYHESEHISTIQNFPFVSYANVLTEAVADVSFTAAAEESDTIGIRQYKGSGTQAGLPVLYAFKFKFDTIFAQNLYTQGFANYKQAAPYLLKIDLRFINDPVKAATKDRTFFLFDNRNLFTIGSTIPTLEEAKYLTIKTGLPIITNGQASYWRRAEERVEPVNINIDNVGSFNMIDRVARVAQYYYISDITDTKTMVSKVKNSAKFPFEIRPWMVDFEGMPIVYPIQEVPLTDRIFRNNTSSSNLSYCNKKNNDWIDYLDIKFEENYSNPSYPTYAAGSLVLPASYFEFTNIDTSNTDQFISSLKNFVKIKVYAQPLAKDFIPTEWNEIIFAEDEDIAVERVLI